MSDPLRPSATADLIGSRTRSARLARASLGTGLGTVVSRLTGLARLVVLAYALGGSRLADAFNLANNTPNMVHDLVLGGVLAATFVPVFVERLSTRPAREANESISAVVTLSAIVLVVATAVFVVAAPLFITVFTFGKATPAEHGVAVELLRLFAPQLLFYGAISLMAAVLATRDRFGAVGTAPIVNNLIGIVVLALFAAIARHDSVSFVDHDQGLVLLLGIGTTVGVALQAVALIPSMRRSGLRLRFVWKPRDPAIRRIVSLSGWTFGFVLANQLAVFVVLALEFHVGPGAVSAYTYAFTFFQFPFAVVATSIINVASPDFARLATMRQWRSLGGRFGTATRQVLALVLPATVGYLVLARPAVVLLLQHGNEGAAAAHLTASVLALFSLGLPGFCVFFLATRTFQAIQDTRSAFVLYALENGINILAAFLLYRPLGVRGLALAYAIAYTLAAIVALMVLRERLGTIGGRALVSATIRFSVLCAVMAFVVALVVAVIGEGTGIGGWLRLFVAVAAGTIVYVVSAGIAATASGWQTSRRRAHLRQRGARGALAPVRIVTDNGGDLPTELVERHGIDVVPLDVRLGDLPAEALRGVDGKRFWELASESADLAETSAPSPGAFADAYRRAADDGCSGVVCVTISSRLSATFQSALAGAEEAPAGSPVSVVDSLSVTMGTGLLVLEAARRAEAGEDSDKIATAITAMRDRVRVMGTLDTLDYLRRGGRIGSAQAFVGSLLSIKPVIEVRDGVVEGESRQRTRARSFDYLADKVAGAGPLAALALVHAAAADVDAIRARLAKIFPPDQTIVAYIGPVIGAHTGPGTVGVCLLRA